MVFFDVTKDWVILASFSVPAARQAAEELSAAIDLLRRRGGTKNGKPPAVADAEASAAAPAAATTPADDSAPLIVLNPGNGGPYRNGFSWRLGRDRLELYGDSGRGLWNGIFDFLAALGFRWPGPGQTELPPPGAKGAYPLRDSRTYRISAPSAAELSRLILPEKTRPGSRDELIRWAARNRIDALIRPLRGPWQKKPAAAETYALIWEAGGRELSLLAPRRFFLFHRDLFRMESGRRVRDGNFCPTNPETIGLLKKEAAALLGPLFRAVPEMSVIHLWPDQDHEAAWCSCPACRAFSAAEQYRIAVNAVADLLAELAPAAKISLYEAPDGDDGDDGDETDAPRNNIPLRPNVFRLKAYPGSAPPFSAAAGKGE